MNKIYPHPIFAGHIMVDATSNYNQSRGLAHVGAGGLRHNLDLHQIQVTRAFVIPQLHSASVRY